MTRSHADHSVTGKAPLVRAENLGVRAGGRWLVRGVTLSVHRGEIVTLVGPNGGGKTTTAKAMLGIVPPNEGHVTRAENLKVGYVPQRLSIDWTLPLTVQRFMTLMRPLPAAGIARALGRAGIGHLARSPLQALSGGEFQRVLIARALTGAPDLLVLDEPVQNVDFAGEIALYDLIAGLRDELGCGILLISHDLHVVMAATDTVVCLNGHVCCQGTPRVVADNPAYVALFGPRAAEAIAVYRHTHDHAHGSGGEVVAAHGHEHAEDG